MGDLRGKVGNVVFDNYCGVHIVRSMPAYINNPQSAYQTYARAAMTVFVQAWKNLTLDQKQLWRVLAVDFIRGKESDARMNRGGLISLPRGPFSGYNLFIACNMNRYMSGYAPLTDILEDAPISKAKPEPLKTFSVSKAGRTLTPAWEYITPGPLNERLEIWIRSIDAGVHPQLIYTEARNADGSTDIVHIRKTGGAWSYLPNGVYQLQCQIVNEYGLVSPPSELVYIQLGGADTFTYLPARLNVFTLNNQAVSIPDTDVDLSATIPAGAHAAIVVLTMYTTAIGTAGTKSFQLYNSLAQGDALRILQDNSQNDLEGKQAHIPLSSDRHMRYSYTHAGVGGTTTLALDLLGYIE